uniref:Uncharacterized protein n=1 Tax=viral metagenome TaxID=1070528 RepID=A0A6M3KYN1_9ZZZZ
MTKTLYPTDTDLQGFKDRLAIDLYGQTTAQATQTDLCIQCKEPALDKCYSDAGRSEYRISGLCEQCFDNIFEEEDNAEEV